MEIYCSCCDKVQSVRVDDCLNEQTNEPYQDIACNECDLVIASGTSIRQDPPKFPTALRKMWSGTEVQQWINENWSKK